MRVRLRVRVRVSVRLSVRARAPDAGTPGTPW